MPNLESLGRCCVDRTKRRRQAGPEDCHVVRRRTYLITVPCHNMASTFNGEGDWHHSCLHVPRQSTGLLPVYFHSCAIS